MENKVYDVVIVGAGPAGLTAGLYASRAKLNTLILEKDTVGGRAQTTREIVNYPGVPNTSGPELTEIMKQQALDFGCEIKKGQVKKYDLEGSVKKLTLRREEILAKAVILANGTSPRILNIPGEKEFTGRGVAYCATCDGEFFKDQEIVVLGSGDQAIEESIYLTRFCKKITIIVLHEEGKLDCNKVAKERAFKNEKLHFIFNSTIQEIYGEDEVEGVILKNVKTQEEVDFKTNGVFMFVGMSANTANLDPSLLNERQWLITNEVMETAMSGVFACGDVRDKFLRQVSTAVGDGAIAAVSAERYLEEMAEFDAAIQEYAELELCFYDSRNKESLEAYGSLKESKQRLDIDVAFHANLKRRFKVELNDQQVIQLLKISNTVL